MDTISSPDSIFSSIDKKTRKTITAYPYRLENVIFVNNDVVVPASSLDTLNYCYVPDPLFV